MLALRLPKDLENRLEKLAAATHRTKSLKKLDKPVRLGDRSIIVTNEYFLF